LLCTPDWPWTCDPPASVSQVLKLKVCTTMPSLSVFIIDFAQSYLSTFKSSSSLLLFCGAADQTQGLTHARQALYHWDIPPATFLF
jgi:hypothetical protein